MAEASYPHLMLGTPPETQAYTSTVRGGYTRRIPKREDPAQHSAWLQGRLQDAWRNAENEFVTYQIDRNGIYLEFRGEPGVVVATVYVAKDAVAGFAQKLVEYAEEPESSGKRPRTNFINSIADLRQALLLESFWTDDKSFMPNDAPEWCEVWLSSDTDQAVQRFDALLRDLQIEAMDGRIRFPERSVKVIRANRSQLELLSRTSDDIAEYRLAKTTSSFWTDLPNREQAEWVQDMLARIDLSQQEQVAVCILDTGVNRAHPLLEPLLSSADCQTVDPQWGSHDHNRHGTLMAGIAAYGDLMGVLLSMASVKVRHRLESVKLLPPPPKHTAPNLWGQVTSQAISRAEIQAPARNRIICMAVTASDTRDRGRPTSWSAELDQLSSGAEDETRRLLIVSAGNAQGFLRPAAYPEAQLTDSIHDPAQSWNSLTVGAYTAMDTITAPSLAGHTPVAPAGGLSPFTTTSLTWDDSWPVKPEIVMEGGNLAFDGDRLVTECDDLSLLSTNFDPQTSHFYPFNMTSAATAQAAWLAAQIQAAYPDLWPESVRALMVHSATWPEPMLQQVSVDRSKAAMKRLLRTAGYGVPNLDRALQSAANSVTLIAQAVLQPFDRGENGAYRTKEMHVYELPWPKDVLLDLPPDVDVQMRVTLSYFVEPGPGEIGWRDRYRYASHGLRFELNSPGEGKLEFEKRINKAARETDELHPGTPSAAAHWRIGAMTRNHGSLHSDIWQGTAAELAGSNLLAVYPQIGWWRERSHLGRWQRQARYALVVSISTPAADIDLYTPIAVTIAVATPVQISIPK